MSIRVKRHRPQPLPPFEVITIPCATDSRRGDKLQITMLGNVLCFASTQEDKSKYTHVANEDVRELAELLINYADYLDEVDE